MGPLVIPAYLDEDAQIVVTPKQLRGLLRSAISMDAEYRRVHGYTDEDAAYAAINEVIEGMAAEVELAERGELKLTSFRVLEEGNKRP